MKFIAMKGTKESNKSTFMNDIKEASCKTYNMPKHGGKLNVKRVEGRSLILWMEVMMSDKRLIKFKQEI